MIKLRLIFIVVLLFSTFSACKVQWVTPYDEVIDHGLKDYKESLNLFVKNMIDKGGTESGTFEANREAYNELEVKIDLLIDRAKMQSEGGCKMATELSTRIVALMGDKLPAELRVQMNEKEGNSFGCTERLLVLVKDQLGLLKQIHATADKCTSEEGGNISCIRPATGPLALDLSNLSINAAWIVETAKKEGGK